MIFYITVAANIKDYFILKNVYTGRCKETAYGYTKDFMDIKESTSTKNNIVACVLKVRSWHEFTEFELYRLFKYVFFIDYDGKKNINIFRREDFDKCEPSEIFDVLDYTYIK